MSLSGAKVEEMIPRAAVVNVYSTGPSILSGGDYIRFAMIRALGQPLARCSGKVFISGHQSERCYLPAGHDGPHGKCGGHSHNCLRFKYPWHEPWDTHLPPCCSYGRVAP